MKDVGTVKYKALDKNAQQEVVQNMLASLEREHYQMCLALKIAEAKLERGLPGAEGEVIDIRARLDTLELSLSALGKLDC